MKELVNCEKCNASISLEEYKCNYCGIRLSDCFKVQKLIKFIRHFELAFLKEDEYVLLDEIEKSEFNQTVYGRYRQLKIQLLIEFKSSPRIGSKPINRILDELINLFTENPEYLKDFVIFFSSLSKVFNNVITIADYNSILNEIQKYRKKELIIIDSSLKELVIIEDSLKYTLIKSYLGETLINEYNFYNDNKNYIDDINFIEKMNHVKNKYLTSMSNVLDKVNYF